MESETFPTDAELIAWRRHFHEHPELSYAEHQTAAYIEEQLRAMGILDVRAPTPTSRVADIVGTGCCDPSRAPRTIALRADIDALPVEEAPDSACRSLVPGCSHACGHDAHAAMLLGAAKALAAKRSAFAGRVRLIFQHGEESSPGGAFELCEAGVLDGVDACVGMHVRNEPLGRLVIPDGAAATSACDDVWIEIEGCGTHASMPEAGIDPLLVGAQMLIALNTIVSRSIAPGHFAVVSPTVFRGGDAVNVIPHKATIGVNVRTQDPADREIIRRRIRETVEGTAAVYGAKASMQWCDGCPAVLQDPGMVRRAFEVAQTLPGQHAAAGKAWSASEDFAAYARRVPSVYVFLGGGSPEEGYPYQNHHPAFGFDERCLAVGARFFTAFALDFLTR